MRNLSKLFLLIVTVLFSFNTIAQDFKNPVEYLEYIGKKNEELSIKYLSYLSAVSHGKSARKVDKRRTEVVNSINETRQYIQIMPPFNGDRSLRDSSVKYLRILHIVFNEDYHKIVNMEEIAEQSYDAMEAYMLAQDKAQEKLQAASAQQNEAQKKFAAANNINLVDNTSELEQKMKTASTLMNHYDDVYLVFFKPYKQEAYLLEALGKNNIVAIEQNIGSLSKFAEEGLEKLKTIKSPNGDASIIAACRAQLLFYKQEAKDAAAFTDFFLKQEEFNKLKKEFDAKPSSKRTQADIDKYNKGIEDINKASDSYNKVNDTLNKQRNAALNDWNKAVKKFLDNYMPTQR
jgi:hypothetical protein